MTEVETSTPARRGLSKGCLILILLVVVILGILAAVLPGSLRRARASANEAFAVGVVRTVVDAEKAYAAHAGSFSSPACLVAPAQEGCLVGAPPGQPALLDANYAEAERAGYRRIFTSGPPRPTPQNPNGLESFCFAVVPLVPGETGTRGFAADQTGKLCIDEAGRNLCVGGSLREGCRELR